MTRLGWHLALIACAVLALALYGQEQRKRGAAEANARQWEEKARALAVLTARVDTQYVTDTVRVWRTKERWDTAFVDVERWKHDTIEVVRYVYLADSTITACSVALLTCEQRVAARDAELRNWQRRWDARPKPPSAVEKWAERAVVFGLGYLVGR